MAGEGPVVVVGGTGMLGGQVVTELLARGKPVRAVVRHASDATPPAGRRQRLGRCRTRHSLLGLVQGNQLIMRRTPRDLKQVPELICQAGTET
jgi:nucleoside-diphosphate-sugar epimerase